MPSINLTDLTLKSIKSTKRQDFWDLKTPSFGVRVGPRSKVFMVKLNNTRKKIGVYPRISLQDARKKALALKGDPTVSGPDMSLQEAKTVFLNTHCAHYKPRVKSETERQLNKLAHLNSRRLGSVSTNDVMHLVDDLKETPSEANHLFKASRTFFRYCVKRRFLQHSPLDGLSLPYRETSRARVLSDEELKCIWRACEQLAPQQEVVNPQPDAVKLHLPANFATIVKLLILTGQRRSEIAGLRAEYCSLNGLDGKCLSTCSGDLGPAQSAQCTITLPAKITKNGREHTFPIGTLASTLLHSASSQDGSTLLFPARGKRHTAFNGWSKAKAALDKLSGVKNFTLHDIRRTYATRLAEMAVQPHVIERLLNHRVGTLSPIALAYNKASYMEEMRAAVDLWDAHIRKLCSS